MIDGKTYIILVAIDNWVTIMIGNYIITDIMLNIKQKVQCINGIINAGINVKNRKWYIWSDTNCKYSRTDLLCWCKCNNYIMDNYRTQIIVILLSGISPKVYWNHWYKWQR